MCFTCAHRTSHSCREQGAASACASAIAKCALNRLVACRSDAHGQAEVAEGPFVLCYSMKPAVEVFMMNSF